MVIDFHLFKLCRKYKNYSFNRRCNPVNFNLKKYFTHMFEVQLLQLTQTSYIKYMHVINKRLVYMNDADHHHHHHPHAKKKKNTLWVPSLTSSCWAYRNKNIRIDERYSNRSFVRIDSDICHKYKRKSLKMTSKGVVKYL